jgi:4-alpha-glucanotransferase
VVYTGTHDNNTARGWFEKEAKPEEKKRLALYLGREITREEIHWELVRLAMMSVANTAIIPMQDILGLGGQSRMNRPAKKDGNWKWRLLPDQLTPSLAEKLLEMTEIYGRA